MSKIIFLDSETTGLDPLIDTLFELAIVRQDGTHKVWTFEPRSGVIDQMHPKAAEVNRYHERTSEPNWRWDTGYTANHSGASLIRTLDEIREELDGAHIVGAVPSFDMRFLADMYDEENEARPKWHYHLIDVENVAYGWLIGAGLLDKFTVPISSDELSRLCGVAPPSEAERHTALGDALWVKRWFDLVTTNKRDIPMQPADEQQTPCKKEPSSE